MAAEDGAVGPRGWKGQEGPLSGTLQGAQPCCHLNVRLWPPEPEGTRFRGLKPLSLRCFATEVGENEHREPVGEKVIVNSSGHVAERGQRTSPIPGQDKEHLPRDAG